MVVALLIYDWLLCFDQEVEFIWNWCSQRLIISSLVYGFSRYALLIMNILTAVTTTPMSDLVRHLATMTVPPKALTIEYIEVLLSVHLFAALLIPSAPSQ